MKRKQSKLADDCIVLTMDGDPRVFGNEKDKAVILDYVSYAAKRIAEKTIPPDEPIRHLAVTVTFQVNPMLRFRKADQ